jgi:3-deoxy-manno-octulosonate cytidylyltransferase (CMP-KDO synthetase)
MQIAGIIPARYDSTRFPGKSLALLAGKPLIRHVIERCRQARHISEVIVATDDARIARAAENFCRIAMTRPDHPSGTDRVAEVVERLDCQAAVNIQGDEPLIDPAVIDAVALALEGAQISTAATALTDPEDFDNPNVVKVVLNAAKNALYFSRRPIPFLRDFSHCSPADQMQSFPFLKHLGIYGYSRESLLQLVRLPLGRLEKAERLEQLRALENGMTIAVVQVNYDSIGVDLPADLARVEKQLGSRSSGVPPP